MYIIIIIIFTYKIFFMLYLRSTTHTVTVITIANPSDLVNHHTRHRVYNSNAVENCYWALLVLKLFVGSTVCN